MVASNSVSLIQRTSERTNTTVYNLQKEVPDHLWGLLGILGRCRCPLIAHQVESTCKGNCTYATAASDTDAPAGRSASLAGDSEIFLTNMHYMLPAAFCIWASSLATPMNVSQAFMLLQSGCPVIFVRLHRISNHVQRHHRHYVPQTSHMLPVLCANGRLQAIVFTKRYTLRLRYSTALPLDRPP